MAPEMAQSNRIVRSWASITAPTGESGRYETEDGSVWRDNLGGGVTNMQTGAHGVIGGGKWASTVTSTG